MLLVDGASTIHCEAQSISTARQWMWMLGFIGWGTSAGIPFKEKTLFLCVFISKLFSFFNVFVVVVFAYMFFGFVILPFCCVLG